MYFLHPLHEPPTMSASDETKRWWASIGSLDVDDGEGAAVRHLLMPDGLARDSGVFQRGRILIPASARHLVPRLAINLLLPMHDRNGKHDLGYSAFLSVKTTLSPEPTGTGTGRTPT